MQTSIDSTTYIADPQVARRALPELSQSAVFLDVDGTLLDLKPDPRDVVSHVELRELLLGISRVCAGALALISGRAIADLDRIFAPLQLLAAGCHGAELRLPEGWWAVNADVMHQVRPQLASFVQKHPGLFLEDKGASLAVHYRARPELENDLVAVMSQLTAQGEVVLQQGKFVVELKPALCDKGSAIATFMSQSGFEHKTPVFFGDDLTDEAGFAEVNKRGGISVRIGASVPSQAKICIVDISTLLECLALWSEGRP